MEIGNGTSKLTNSKNIEGEINANGNQAILVENRLKGNFVSKNVVSLSKRKIRIFITICLNPSLSSTLVMRMQL